MSNLEVHNMVAGSLGSPHKHPCGIPQGCPLSMMLIAFLLRPWISVMKNIGAIPRILADDILVFAKGLDHEAVFLRAFEATHVFFDDIGAQLAPSKSTTFSTVRTTRAKLRKHMWKTTGTLIACVLHARDLGSHMNTGARMCAPTLTARLEEATQLVQRIGRTNFPPKFFF